LAKEEDINNQRLQIDLAVVQIVTTILITLGATLFAVGIGFDIAIPSILNRIIESDSVDLQGVDDVFMSSTLNNYGFILTSIGAIMVIMGVVYGSASLAKIRKRGKNMPHH
jgi:hypothetical protein